MEIQRKKYYIQEGAGTASWKRQQLSRALKEGCVLYDKERREVQKGFHKRTAIQRKV